MKESEKRANDKASSPLKTRMKNQSNHLIAISYQSSEQDNEFIDSLNERL
ncbi:16937_t:CDS:2 [Cetraspora pellucida]|uniref:16937_t:CDS:1 n=1 Tax=Cetraspora pellucida TaxID=1433469 RepID=A0A9N8ZTF9_9GLOM|nr:16937_t:CDS:2 [Cetraspora pellucida]